MLSAQVVGLDSYPTQHPDSMQQLLVSHVENMRANPFLKAAHILFIPENNSGFISLDMSKIVEQFPRVTSLYEDKKNKRQERDPGESLHVCPGIVTSKFEPAMNGNMQNSPSYRCLRCFCCVVYS